MKEFFLNDLKEESKIIKHRTLSAISKVITNADYILGKEVDIFEKTFSKYCNSKYAIGVASGMSALFLSLMAANIGPGDEVITTAVSFAATIEAIIMTGATPRLVDVDINNLSIDTDKIEKQINEKTKAVIPVYLYGFPAKIDEIKKICKKNNLLLIGDCSQAHGAIYKGKIIGWQEDLACFSFMAAKNLGAYGDAGCVVTNNQTFYKKIKKLRDHGRASKYVHEIMGYTERLDNIQAAILNVKFRYLEKWNYSRREIAKNYINCFKNHKKIGILKPFKDTNPCFYQFPILIKNRDELSKKLLNKNIHTGIHYPIPLHLQPSFKCLRYKEGDFPNSELLTQKILSLPMHPFLSKDDIILISKSVIKYAK